MSGYNKNEVIRYMGYRNSPLDDNLDSKIKDAYDDLLKVYKPRAIYKLFDVLFEEPYVYIGDMKVNSRKLSLNLQGCSKAFLVACTIGVDIDRLIRKKTIESSFMGSLYQAVASSMVEYYIDELEKEIISQLPPENAFLKPRYSPGYGDMSLSYQREFERMLSMSKTCGISLLESNLMVPSKSITAVIGVSSTKGINNNKCDLCDNIDCKYK